MSEQVKQLLLQLENELKLQQLWSPLPPDAAALASTLPFCVDTLPLQGWLQYVFIPRMQALLASGAALPANMSLLAIAEQAFAPLGGHTQALLQLIAELDNTVAAAN
jgi:uncharacterized protein YqcC (DUF446 family)